MGREPLARGFAGAVTDELDDQAPTAEDRRADALRALYLIFDDMPAGVTIDAHRFAALLGPLVQV